MERKQRFLAALQHGQSSLGSLTILGFEIADLGFADAIMSVSLIKVFLDDEPIRNLEIQNPKSRRTKRFSREQPPKLRRFAKLMNELSARDGAARLREKFRASFSMPRAVATRVLQNG
jgi:hypothetical protein